MKLPPIKKQSGEPSWFYRRLAIYGGLLWSAYQLNELRDATDSRLNESLAWGWQLVFVALIFFYTGFATMQDIVAIWTTRTAKPYAEPPQEPTPAPEQTVVVMQETKE